MLKEKLLEDLKDCMKEKKIIRKNVIQMVRAAILQIEKDKQIQVTDEQIMEIIAKETKKRKESISDFEKGNRMDMVEQLKQEISVLEEYLPKQLTKEEVQQKVSQIIQNIGATSIKEMGIVMKQAKQEIGTASDGKTINEVVKELLNA